MKSFANLNDLKNYIKSEIYDISKNEVSEEGKNKLKESIDETVYSRPENDYYERTYAMKNSTDSNVSRSSDGVHIKIFNNPDKMDYSYPSWHPEKYGNDHRKSIINWLNNGHGGIISYEEQRFIERAEDKLDKELKKILVKGLNSRGIDTK